MKTNIGSIFSFTFILTLSIFLVIIFIITILIRMVIVRRCIRKISHSLLTSTKLKRKLFSPPWSTFDTIAKESTYLPHLEIIETIKQQVYATFNRLDSATTMAKSLDKKKMGTLSIKEITNISVYITKIIEDEQTNVHRLCKEMSTFLEMSKCLSPTQPKKLKQDSTIYMHFSNEKRPQEAPLSTFDSPYLMEGNLITNRCSVFVKGSVRGNIKSIHTINIGKTAAIHGDIYADYIVVEGFINGNITSTKEIIFSANSHVIGNIFANSIKIKKGAKIIGSVCIGKNIPIQE